MLGRAETLQAHCPDLNDLLPCSPTSESHCNVTSVWGEYAGQGRRASCVMSNSAHLSMTVRKGHPDGESLNSFPARESDKPCFSLPLREEWS